MGSNRPRFDHFTVGCLTVLILAVIAALVILTDTHHSQDVRSAALVLVNFVGAAATVASVQSVRNGVGKTNNSIENGVLQDKIAAGVKAELDARAERYKDSPRLNGENQ